MTRHVFPLHTRFSDVDVYGHVNNVKYFEYFQEARIAFLTALGCGERFGVVVARVDVDYKRPVLFRTEPYAVASWITRVGTSSFGLAAEIRDGDSMLSRAEAVLVTFDTGTQSARPLTGPERERLLGALEA